MTMMVNKKLLFICMLPLIFTACGGEDFNVGGAGIEGTGHPPNDTHIGNDGQQNIDKKTQFYFEWTVPASVSDQCHGLKRTIEFLDPYTHEPLSKATTVRLGRDLNSSHAIIKLSFQNQSNESITESFTDCKVLPKLYDRDTGKEVVSEDDIQCPSTERTYAPQQTGVLFLNYEVLVGSPMHLTVAYGVGNQYSHANIPLEACTALSANFDFKLKDVEHNLDVEPYLPEPDSMKPLPVLRDK